MNGSPLPSGHTNLLGRKREKQVIGLACEEYCTVKEKKKKTEREKKRKDECEIIDEGDFSSIIIFFFKKA